VLRYLTNAQLTIFLNGSVDRDHWVTPTAISSSVVVNWLALFAPGEPRQYALLHDPVRGSRYCEVSRGEARIRARGSRSG
jgi:hypothetical protein